ncbi:DUF5694 domain-containing protein [Myroides odoratimimus]|uniref:DUF5694 domain-containing protein n=1 Tax=Myroides odoratimimus TaxID=76832 RepID=UPI0004682E3C|nr:DUF5694 domain-containing protein [Myroides odoratimimus]
MKTTLFSLLVMCLMSGQFANAQINKDLKLDKRIPVFNMGTFHMGITSDSHSTEFDEHDAKNKAMVHEVARAIAAFKPTVIIVELPPSSDEFINKEYNTYLADPKTKFKNPDEVELLAFEIGRLSGVKRLYGIDYKESYNYTVGDSLVNYNDKALVESYWDVCIKQLDERESKSRDVKQMLYNINTQKQYDAMFNLNADILTHVSSPGKSEGADEAAKFYHRNLVMYSNLNQLPLTDKDRVFILMGSTHTAFFNMWLNRSPKYKAVNVLDYLKKFK